MEVGMRKSGGFLKIGMVLFLFLVCISNAFAAKSGYISFVSPDPLNCGGSSENVTVRIVNTGDDGDIIIEPDPIPSGWNVSPPSRNVFLPSGSSYYATFSVTPPPNDSSGIITWKLYYEGLFFDTLLDTYNQTVNNTIVISGIIVDVSPDPLYCEGSPENVTVRIRNTGTSSGEMRIEPAPMPPGGWNVSPGFRTQYIPPGSEYSAPFTVTPPSWNSSDTIVWNLYESTHPDPLDTYYQSVFNTMPVQIDSITPNPAQPPSQMIHFEGTGGNYSVQWEWISNLDGTLSTVEDFDKSSYQMTVGSHTIEFRVRHSHTGFWSDPDNTNLTVLNALPTATLSILIPIPFPPGSNIKVDLGGYDNDEYGQSIIECELWLDNQLIIKSAPGVYDIIVSSPGDCMLKCRVKDDEGSWSNFVQEPIHIPNWNIMPIPDANTLEERPYIGPTPQLFDTPPEPVVWSLIEGPNDMWIDDSTGVVLWDDPNLYGSPHPITIRATISAGYDDETWILTVVSLSDFDSDGVVNFGDFAILAYYWNWADYICSEPDWCEGSDSDESGYVDFIDLQEFIEDWLWEY